MLFRQLMIFLLGEVRVRRSSIRINVEMNIEQNQFQYRENQNNQGQPLLGQHVENVEDINPEIERLEHQLRALAFLNFLVGLQNQREEINYDALVRLNDEEKKSMDGVECSIWISPFLEDPAENLVRLPWNKDHVFHENCIVSWLNQNQNCPLCRQRVTQEAIQRYART